jgi:hypothetical protein
MSVVLIRGTSGSGKTTIAEKVIARLGGLPQAEIIRMGPNNRKVGGYVWQSPPVLLVGKYGAQCGGIDTMRWAGFADEVEKCVLEQIAQGRSVLMEGLVTLGVERLVRIGKATSLTVIHLDTLLVDCIASVNQRRMARGEMEPVDETATRVKYKQIFTTNKTNRRRGIKVETHSRATALPRVMELLGL